MRRRQRASKTLPYTLTLLLMGVMLFKLYPMRLQQSFRADVHKIISAAIPGLITIALVIGLSLSIRSLVKQVKRDRRFKQQRGLKPLQSLTWQQFEQVMGNMFERLGYKVTETGQGGADGGIDLLLRKQRGVFLVQCKRWNKGSVGAPVVREMFGLMMHHQAQGVKIVTTGKFTKEAIAFAKGKPIDLLDGEILSKWFGLMK